ncbi:hypothetical protein OKW23_000491 [Bacilli bacterium PM5-9]|nr:hypothetical protein [Bacilli bacterium PM5-9]
MHKRSVLKNKVVILFFAFLLSFNIFVIKDINAIIETGDIKNSLKDSTVVITPDGYYRNVSVDDDGSLPGKVLHLYNIGTTSKFRLEWYDGKKGEEDDGYLISHFKRFDERGKSELFWDVQGTGKPKAGGEIHVWTRDDSDSRQNWNLERNSDGTYYIVNSLSKINSLKDEDSKKLYVSLEKFDDANNVELKLSEKPFKWNIEVIDADDAKRYDYSTYSSARKWMKNLPDEMMLSEVNMPGVHDAATGHVTGDAVAQSSLAQTQRYYIDEMLKVGVRSFDLRLGYGDDPSLVHGTEFAECKKRDNKVLHLSDVMSWMRKFLSDNPSESIVISLKSDKTFGNDEKITLAMEKYLKDYPDLFWTEQKTPTVKQARGKIIVLRRYNLEGNKASNKDKMGLDVTNWDEHNTSSTAKRAHRILNINSSIKGELGAEVWIQDYYSTDETDKKKFIEGTFEQTATETHNRDAYFFNFTSIADGPPIGTARTINRDIRHSEYIKPTSNDFVGIVMMDYIDGYWAKKIYEKNFASPRLDITFPTSIKAEYGDKWSEVDLVGSSIKYGNGYFKIEDLANHPEVSDTGKKIQVFYVEPREYGDDYIVPGPFIPLEVTPEKIEIGVNSYSVPYASKKGDDGYVDPTNISDMYVMAGSGKGELKFDDTVESIGVRVFAHDNNVPILDTMKTGEFKLDGDLSKASKNYTYTFSNLARSYYKVIKRTADLSWTKLNYIHVGDAIGENGPNATIKNLVTGDDCLVDKYEYYQEKGNKLIPLTNSYKEAGYYIVKAISLKGDDSNKYVLKTGKSNEEKRFYVRASAEAVMPEKAIVTYGETLDTAIFEGGSGSGTFTLVSDDSSKKLEVGTYTTGYQVHFEPDNILVDTPKDADILLKVIPRDISFKLKTSPEREYGNELITLTKKDLVLNGGTYGYQDSIDSLNITLKIVDNSDYDISGYNTTGIDNLKYNLAPIDTYRIVKNDSDLNKNYNVSVEEGSYEIKPRLIAIEWVDYSNLVYDGTSKNVKAVINNLVANNTSYEDCYLVIDGGDKINAGVHQATITGLAGNDAKNYQISDGTLLEKDYSIAKRVVNLSWTNINYIRIGDEIGVNGPSATINNLVNSDDCIIASYEYYKVVNDDLVLINDKYNDSGFHVVKAISLSGSDSSNYQILKDKSNEERRFFVRASDEAVMPEKAILTYGDTFDKAQFEGGSGSGTFTLTNTDGSLYPNVGEYSSGYTVHFEPDNILVDTPKDASIVLEVIPRDISFKVNKLYQEEYGNELASFTNSDLDLIEGSYAYSENINSLNISLKIVDENDYDLSNYNISDSTSKKYNRASVGVYRIVNDADVSNKNYNITIENGSYTIKQRRVMFEWDGYENLVYTGNKVNIKANITNLVPKDSLKRTYDYDDCNLLVANGRKINAGTYQALIVRLIGKDSSNYYVEKGINLGQVYTIDKASPSVVFPNEAVITYGQSVDKAIFDGSESSSVSGDFFFVKSDDKPNAGIETREMYFDAKDMNNYNRVLGNTKLIIEQAAPKIPSGFSAKIGSNEKLPLLKTFILPKGWTWKNPNQSVKKGTYAYKANYHDDNGNYFDMIDVDINVKITQDSSDKNPDKKPPKTGSEYGSYVLTLSYFITMLSVYAFVSKKSKQ